MSKRRKPPRPRNRAANRRRPTPRRPRWVGPTIAAVAVAVLVGLGALAASSGSSNAGSVTDPTRFDLPALTGSDRVRLADHRGTPVVVNMFASWCEQCRFELPGFADAARTLRGKVDFVGVNSLETGNGTAMADEYHLADAGFVLARDVGGAQGSGLHDAVGARGMPATIFYDANGNILEVERAAIPPGTLKAKLHAFYGVDV